MSLSPDQYMDLLAKRRDDYYAEHEHIPGFPALLDWFIQPGDEDLVDMTAIETANRAADDTGRPRQPRRYRPASHWRERLAAIQARLDALNGIQRHDTDDRAAHGGIGIRQTSRQRAQYGKRIDRVAAEYVELERERRDVAAKLRRAEAREASRP